MCIEYVVFGTNRNTNQSLISASSFSFSSGILYETGGKMNISSSSTSGARMRFNLLRASGSQSGSGFRQWSLNLMAPSVSHMFLQNQLDPTCRQGISGSINVNP